MTEGVGLVAASGLRPSCLCAFSVLAADTSRIGLLTAAIKNLRLQLALAK
jgi:alkanesulfonate monooxygenase SsuD/methylene tetrahydromethanopterin reductase-like flavin-dependent oxidoreductase (luciferase family)